MDVDPAGGAGRDVRVAVEPPEEFLHQAEVDVKRQCKRYELARNIMAFAEIQALPIVTVLVKVIEIRTRQIWYPMQLELQLTTNTNPSSLCNGRTLNQRSYPTNTKPPYLSPGCLTSS